MKKVLDVKTWKDSKEPQFRIVAPHKAVRTKDNLLFASDGSLISKIYFENRIGHILEFMSNYVHVQIEVKKTWVSDYENMEFDPDNYDDKKKYWKIFEFTNENLSSLSNEDRDYWEDEDNQNKIYAKCSEAAIDILEGREPEEISDEEE